MSTIVKHNRWTYINRGCRCTDCRADYRTYARTRTKHHHRPSLLAQEVEQLNAELDAAEMRNDAQAEEIAMLYCRLQELET